MSIPLKLTQGQYRRITQLLATGKEQVSGRIATELQKLAKEQGWLDYYAIQPGSSIRVKLIDTKFLTPPEYTIELPQ